MKRIKDICFFSKYTKIAGEISQLGPSCCHNYHSGIPQAKAIAELRSLLPQRGSLCENLLQQAALGTGARVLSERLILARKLSWRFDLPFSCKDSPLRSKESALVLSCKYGQSVKTETCLSRDFLVQLWIKDRKVKSHKSKKRVVQHSQSIGPISRNQPLRFPFGRWFTAVPVAEEKYDEQVKPVFKQPPPSQSATGFLKPSSPEEAKVAPLLARSNLLITRDIEWANLVFGFEQENRYAIVDACYPHSPVGFMREQSNFIARQLLRLRRPFIAYITDAMGNELFRIRRPFWWITSTIYAEIDGKEIGVVHRRWHLWRRVYDLYLGKKQFAVVENPGFWNWTFTLKDVDGKVLAEINRDWRGFGFELLTDAGQYVIRFGCSDPRSKIGPARAIQDLEVTRPLTLSERAVTLALAVSLDNDYFSRHGGWGLPVIAVTE